MTWTYYRMDYGKDLWIVFRDKPDGPHQVYHRQNGWQDTDMLFERRQKGDISSSDIISEAEAKALIATLP